MTESPLSRVLVFDNTPSLRADYADLLRTPDVREQEDALAGLTDDDALAGFFGCLAPPPGFPAVDLVLPEDGAAALAALKKGRAEGKPFAAAFIELREEDLESGLRLLEAARAADPALHLVAVCGDPEPHPLAVARRVPPVDQMFYLKKPFHPYDIHSLVLALTARWQGERKRGAAADGAAADKRAGPGGAYDALPCGLIVFDRRDRLVSANAALRAILPEIEAFLVPGLPYEELQKEIARRLLPDDTLFLEDAWVKERLEWHAKSGGVIDQRLSGGRWLVLAESGGPLGETYCLFLDITPLRRRDRNRMASQRLRQVTEAMEAFCHALADAADEKGRLSVKGLGQRLFHAGNRAADGGAAGDGAIDGVDEGNGALAALARKLRIVTQASPLLAEPLRLDRLIADILRDKESLRPKAVDIETVAGAGLWEVDADIAHIRAALTALIDNALAASGTQGRIVIETENRRLDRDFVASRPALTQGDYVHLSVRDEGEGMTAEQAERAFTPFYRGQPAAAGHSGLGLSLALGAVNQSGGHLEIETERGEGTALHLYLPRAKMARGGGNKKSGAQAAAETGADGMPDPDGGPRPDDDEGMIW